MSGVDCVGGCGRLDGHHGGRGAHGGAAEGGAEVEAAAEQVVPAAVGVGVHKLSGRPLVMQLTATTLNSD